MCGHTRKDQIRNDHKVEQLGVAPITEKRVENRLRWFGHAQRRPIDAPVRKVDQSTKQLEVQLKEKEGERP